MKPSGLRVFSTVLIAFCVTASLGFAVMLFQESSNVLDDRGFVTLDQRTVENVTCAGECDNVILTSDQEPGKVYFSNVPSLTYRPCTPVSLWANRIREDQIGINGYLLYQGAQVNLRPVTIDATALDGRLLEYSLNDNVSGPLKGVFSSSFMLHLKDTGDWNLIDPDSFTTTGADALVITSQYADDRGTVSLANTCTAPGPTTYTLYQSPNLAGPGEPLTYLVSVGRLPESTEEDAFTGVTVFEKNYTEEEMSDDVVHVDVADGATTFGFDLVK